MGLCHILHLQLATVKPPNKLAKTNKAVIFERTAMLHYIRTCWHRCPKAQPAVASSASACGD